MKVHELMEFLDTGCDQDMEVHFAYNYGDYWRTTVAPKVTKINLGTVKWSAYHQMDELVSLEEDSDDEPEVVVLS